MRHAPPPRRLLRATAAAPVLALAVLLLGGCQREDRRFVEIPAGGTGIPASVQSDLSPGPVVVSNVTVSDYEDNAYAQSQGQQLFNNMNCVGCHSHGGGGMGPALMDDQWIYGSDPAAIYATIMEGRPNGMPSWRGKLTSQQVWQLVAYVRSLSGLGPKGARSGRSDHMEGRKSPMNTPSGEQRRAFIPPASQMP